MKIDVFQDTVCPWCRIGKAHLLQALETWKGEPVEIRYRAFLLDPTTPQEGKPMSTLVEKLGGAERAQEMHAHVCKIGEACGLDFQFDQIEHLPNTLLSHQLIKLAPADKQQQIVEALHDAYFQFGKDIGDIDVLIEIANQNGLDADSVRDELQRESKLPEVMDDLNFAREAGISGVPFFIFNDKYALSGAQPVEVFLQALEQIHSEG
ncbi:DsbA family oxidoreductase [Alicyclobacillus dauci]|uniref:DsbA family oxidoreductase n=1 Tax=Alicyclobacillus dauci TaxID=1475485 RepID=A0ABY6Z4U8_9BACL|nr:DsbA family oxidoreductase [Alicyclobacillus dauci]WAH37226.1 DsbA family oxidoreductase [Alicyclobacillus dauci]